MHCYQSYDCLNSRDCFEVANSFVPATNSWSQKDVVPGTNFCIAKCLIFAACFEVVIGLFPQPILKSRWVWFQ